MKTLKKFATSVMNLSLVAVPVFLLACGLNLATGALWDVMTISAMAFLLVYAGKKYIEVRNGKESLECARNLVALFGVLACFLPLAAQAVLCMVGRAGSLPAEGAMVWMFILVIAAMSSLLKENKPKSNVLYWGIVLAMVWLSVCVIGGIFDFCEYFTGQETPERLGNFFGILAPITGIGAAVLCIIGIISENRC